MTFHRAKPLSTFGLLSFLFALSGEPEIPVEKRSQN